MKFFYTLIALCVALPSFAQLEKGGSFITGNLSYSVNNDKDAPFKTSYGSANVGYGRLVANNLAVGLELSGNVNKTEPGNTSGNSVIHDNALNLSPFVRRYFSVTEKLYLNVDGQLTYGRLKSWSETSGTNFPPNIRNRYAIAITPGATYFVSERFALNAMLGSLSYSMIKGARDSDDNRSVFAASLGLRYFTLGLSMFF